VRVPRVLKVVEEEFGGGAAGLAQVAQSTIGGRRTPFPPARPGTRRERL
jgi:hypothetical protein